MKLYAYDTYEDYVHAQRKGNKKKIDKTWARQENIAVLSEYLKNRFRIVSFGICHGTRRGYEQRWFADLLQCRVIGTEIGPSARKFAHTIRWDFHETHPAWIGAADFIYSNSLDHAADPEKAVRAWMSCLKPEGVCLIEWSTRHGEAYSTKIDPFGASLEELQGLIAGWGFRIADVLTLPVYPAAKGVNHALVVTHA